MLETQEKTMDNAMSEESMQTSMCESTDEMQMEATPKKMDEMPECAIIGLIKNHILDLDEKLHDAKMRYADASLDDDNWSGKYERKMECKILEGKMEILNTVQKNFENMFTPKAAMQ